jgi:hypothetical protein
VQDEDAMTDNEREFPGLDGLDYIGWINTDVLDHVILNFYSGAPDGTAVYNTYVYLLLGRIVEADFACDPHFPEIERIEHNSFREQAEELQNWIGIYFKKGHLAFTYKSASFQMKTTFLQKL